MSHTSMDSHSSETLEKTDSSPLPSASVSVQIQQTLGDSSSASHPAPPTVIDLDSSNSHPIKSILGNILASEDGDGHDDSTAKPLADDDRNVGNDLLCNVSSIHTLSGVSRQPHCPGPCNSGWNFNSWDSYLPQMSSSGDSSKPSDPHWKPWGSAGGSRLSAAVLDDSEASCRWSFLEEDGANVSVSVSPELIEEEPSMVGAGLANLGNTCFMNAILQCFTHTVPLVRGLRLCNHALPCTSKTEGFCVICELQEHTELSIASSGRVVSPVKLVDNLNYISSSFRRFQQEDAHEFLQCFLDTLDSCYSDSKRKYSTSCLQGDSFVKDVFGGRLVSKLRCCNCDNCSDTYEPLIDLSLEIGDVSTLASALESFTTVEKLEDPEMQFTCEKCKQAVSVEKQLVLEDAPSVATFHLKRFKNDGSFVQKIDKYVEFPLELDLQPFCSGRQSSVVDLKYDLYAVVVHVGFSSTSGHYYCFIRSSPDKWYKFDDSQVVRVRESFVLSQEAYILFYAKQGTPWFESFMEIEKPTLVSNLSNTSPKSVLDNVDYNSTSPTVENRHVYVSNATSERTEKRPAESSVHDMVEVFEVKDDLHRISTSGPTGANDSSVKSSYIVENDISLFALKECNSIPEFGKVENQADASASPTRSPSPEIYREEPPDRSISVPQGHLKLVGQLSSKKQLNKELEGSESKEVRRLLKGMPHSRKQQFLAAMRESLSEGPTSRRHKLSKEQLDPSLKGSRSEGFVNKKRSRTTDLSPNIHGTSASARQRSDLGSVIRSLAAGSFR